MTLGTQTVRVLALGWLVVFEPLDLATTVARFLPRLLDGVGAAFFLLILARVVTVALGMAAGLSLWRGAPATRVLATVWLAAEVVTLGLVWSTSVIPTNRPPGMLAPMAVLYAVMGGLVWAAARGRSARRA